MNLKKIMTVIVFGVLAQGFTFSSFAAISDGACKCQCAKHHTCQCSKCSDCKKQ